MIERVARALFEQNDKRAGQPSYERDLRWSVSQSFYIEDARAVLTAMREPTEVMVGAGRWPAEDDGPAACWTAMIDAALAQGGERE